MSHSVFRDLDEDKTSGNGTRGEVAENNLIVFIKKDGGVQVDPNALQDLIVNANTETKSTVSVIRLGSPTPSMEIDDGESSTKQSDDDENNNSGAENDDDDANDDDEEEVGRKNSDESNEDSDLDITNIEKLSKSKKKKKKNKVPGIGLTVEEFYNPEQAIQFATEIMNIAGITNPKQLKADYEHLRYIIQNDHCYTPYTYADSLTDGKSNDLTDGTKNVSNLKLTTTPLTNSTTMKKVGRSGLQTSKSTPTNGLDVSNSSRFDDVNSSNENTADQNESDEEEIESESDEEDVEEDNDRDSDLDFSVNDCHSRRAKKIKKRKIQVKKLANKKRRQSTIDFTSDDNLTPKGKKTTKLPKKSFNTSGKSVMAAAVTTSTSPTVSSTTSKSPATTSTSSRLTKVTYVKDVSHENLTPKVIPIQKISSTTNSQVTPTSSGDNKPQKVIIMRNKVRKEQTENALSGMSSLFTPDIVVKPKSKTENSVVTNKAPNFLNKPITTSTPNTKNEMVANTMKPVVVQSIANTSQDTTTQRFITTKMIKSPTITYRKIHKSPINLESEQDKQLDLIDSLLQEKLNKSETEAMPLSNASQSTIPPDIPNIVKMLETSDASTPIESNDLIQSNSTSMTYTTTHSAHDSQMLPDEFLEDFLTDDLLQHVAKLVDDDKNLQEVIDQEIQGGSSTTSISSCPITSQTQIQSVSTILKPNAMPTNDATPTKVSEELKAPVNIIKTPTTPSNLSTPTTNKKEIKVKRADGSFITLPPIEAPTTRGAKRRAETTPGSETQHKQKIFTMAAQSDSPTQNQQKSVSNTPTNETIKSPSISASKAKPILARERRASVAVKRASLDSKPRRSLSISNPRPIFVANDDDDDDEEDGSDGSYNSEDDPNRIWCICRTPHNNRFMICCDKCEEWFHGKCVGITRQMGREMEERQSEWICPNCIKKRQPSIQNIFPRKTNVEGSPKTKESSVPNCVVCGVKPSRLNSIYCSDDCIRKHATKAVSSTASNVTESDSTTTNIKSPSEKKFPQPKILNHLFKDKMNHVVIYDKATNTFLTGKNAPTQDKLQKWLAEHPNHEVLKPGSRKAEEFKERQSDALKKKQQQLKSIAKTMASERELFAVTQPAKIQTTLQFESNKMVYVNPTTQKQVTNTSLKRPISAITSPGISKSPLNRSGEPISKAPKLSSTPSSTQKSNSTQKKRTPDAKKSTHNKSSTKSNEQDQLRVNARKSLIEQLLARTTEITDANAPRLTESEITEFIFAAESEMFEMFGGDTNMKYKSKYRSLIYNIKDRKNLTLFEKISSKAIEPKQLVRMSTEELASQELAKWRENETKHQLEMITKSELDMLACGNSYVLKTHKGEEVIQESAERSIPVEDLASVLNNSAVSSSDTVILTKDNRVDKYLSADGGKSASKSSNKKDAERGHDKKDRHDSRSSGSSSKHKRKRSRERHSHSSHSHSHKDRSHDKDRKDRSSSGGGSGGGASGSADSKKDKKDHKSSSSSSSSSSSRSKHHTEKDRKRDSINRTNAITSKNQQTDDSSIADKILKAQSTINSILHPEEFKKISETTTTNVSSATEECQQFARKQSITAAESDQEPTSTVTIPSPPELISERQSTTPPPIEKSLLPIVWSGSISMVDVATFQVSLSPLSGSTAMIDFPKEFDVVGRINPETVWEYLEKIRISKDIILLKFSPRSKSEDNETAYSQFITYLDARKRLGVIKIPSKFVKDFYIMPMTSHKSLPTILKTTTGFDLGADRPDLLLGIIVRNRISPPANHLPIPPKHRQPIPFVAHKSAMTIPAKEPPSSPNMNISVQKISKQVIKSTFSSNLDDDEPYSPGGSDDDDLTLTTIPNSYMSSTSGIVNPIPDYTKPIVTSNFDKQQLEELNRQIEAEKKEIAMMHLQHTVDIDEPYSPTSSVSPPINQNLSDVVSNISIPANLADILKNVASFGSTQTANQIPINQYTTSLIDTSDNEYVPMAPATSTITSYAPTPSSQLTQTNAAATVSSQPSKLAQLTDEELMRLVPDEID